MDHHDRDKKYTLEEAHKEFALRSNGRVWQLLAQPQRSPSESDELLYAVHASAYHWLQVGQGVHRQRAEYLIAKAYLVLGVAERALHHAQRCMDLTDQYRAQMKSFDLAYAHECMARALALVGQRDIAAHHFQRAKTMGDAIEGEEDKKIFEQDFSAGDWFGID